MFVRTTDRRAVERLQEAEVKFYDRLVDPDLLELARRDSGARPKKWSPHRRQASGWKRCPDRPRQVLPLQAEGVALLSAERLIRSSLVQGMANLAMFVRAGRATSDRGRCWRSTWGAIRRKYWIGIAQGRCSRTGARRNCLRSVQFPGTIHQHRHSEHAPHAD